MSRWDDLHKALDDVETWDRCQKSSQLIPVANDPEYENIKKHLIDRLNEAIAVLKKDADYKVG